MSLVDGDLWPSDQGPGEATWWMRPVGSPQDFAAAYAVRHRVFVTEQRVPLEEELDRFDPIARHVIVGFGDQVIATGRLIPPEGVGPAGELTPDHLPGVPLEATRPASLVAPDRPAGCSPEAAGPWHLGRIAVDAPWRGHGLGRAVMARLERWAQDGDAAAGRDCTVLELSAQLQAAGFYQGLGYELYGPVYLDAGIEHRDARKVVRHAAGGPSRRLD